MTGEEQTQEQNFGDNTGKTQTPETAEPVNLIDKAESISNRIKEQNDRYEALVKRQEEAAARLMLSGKAQAGEPTKSPEQSEAEEIDKRVSDLIQRKF